MMNKMITNKMIRLVSLFCMAFLFFSCQSKNADKKLSTPTSGIAPISVDESFRPIIEQEILVFENRYPDAGILPIYTNEVEAINLLLRDSVRLAVATRTLSLAEKESLESRKLFAREIKIATDGIAVITHTDATDTLMTVSQLRQIMTGGITRWSDLYPGSQWEDIQLVFDNTNSGTVRFAIDSICKGERLSGNLYAQHTNEQVIEYVAQTPGALGIIGVSWLQNKADSTRLSFLDKVKLVSLSTGYTANPGNSYKPYQAYLALRQYPLTRDVYAIITDPRNGLPSGFITFMSSDIGQKIILKEGIVPATQIVRIVNIKDNF